MSIHWKSASLPRHLASALAIALGAAPLAGCSSEVIGKDSDDSIATQALLTQSVFTPRAFIILTGKVICCIV